jgi:hypothetical protein
MGLDGLSSMLVGVEWICDWVTNKDQQVWQGMGKQ